MNQDRPWKVSAIAMVFAILAASSATAQLPRMGPPIVTTMVLKKPAPDEIFGNKGVIKIGLGAKTYKFILKDAYVDNQRIRWPDIWEYVRQFDPNMNAEGLDEGQFAKMQPGETLTIRGMFAPLDRTFEITGVQQENGIFSPPKTY